MLSVWPIWSAAGKLISTVIYILLSLKWCFIFINLSFQLCHFKVQFLFFLLVLKGKQMGIWGKYVNHYFSSQQLQDEEPNQSRSAFSAVAEHPTTPWKNWCQRRSLDQWMCTAGNRSKPNALRKRAHAAGMRLTFNLATRAALLLEVEEMIAVRAERGVEGFPPQLVSCDVTLWQSLEDVSQIYNFIPATQLVHDFRQLYVLLSVSNQKLHYCHYGSYYS